ncbi:hypothetical protein ACFQY0_13560 [Haloferula chungangensis]|uniref:Uncharacterized protein n=1 Tax=Haloferula chungangensis TaxID=1048331 RepID=A0ABW2L9U5_9BACT
MNHQKRHMFRVVIILALAFFGINAGMAQTQSTLRLGAPFATKLSAIPHEIQELDPSKNYAISGAPSWLTITRDPNSGFFELSASTQELEVGTYNEEIIFANDGETAHRLQINLSVHYPLLVEMVAHRDLPFLYAIHRDSSLSGVDSLVRIDATTLRPIEAVSLGTSASDLSIDYENQRVLCVSHRPGTAHLIPIDDFSSAKSISLPDFPLTYNFDGKIESIGEDLIAYIDGFGPTPIRIYRLSTSSVVFEIGPEQLLEDGGSFSALLKDPNKPILYAYIRRQGAFAQSGRIVSLATNDEGALQLQQTAPEPTKSTLSSASKVFQITADGKHLFFLGSFHELPSLKTVPSQGRQNAIGVSCVSPTGTYGLGSSNSIIDMTSGESLFPLSNRATACTFTSDYDRLIRAMESRTVQADAWSVIQSTHLLTALGGTLPGMTVSPKNGEPVVAEPTLNWPPMKGVTSWDVFVSESPSDLPSHETLVGSTPFPTFALENSLPPGVTRYWTVRPTGGGQHQAVESFTTSDLHPESSFVGIRSMEGVVELETSINVHTANTTIWSVSTTDDWIKVPSAELTGPGQLKITLDTADLGAGYHQGSIRLSSQVGVLTVPVKLILDHFRVSELIADPLRPGVIGYFPPQTNVGVLDGYIYTIDPEILEITSAVRLDSDVSSIAIRREDGKVILCSGIPYRIVTLDQPALDTIGSFPVDQKVNSISTIGDDTLILERQFGFDVHDSSDGTLLYAIEAGVTGSASASYYDPVNGIYTRISSSQISRYSMDRSGASLLGIFQLDQISDNIFVSQDLSHFSIGRLIFDGESKFKTQLNLPSFTGLGGLTADGALGFTTNRFYFTDSGTEAGRFPFNLSYAVADSSGERIIGFGHDDELASFEISSVLSDFETFPRDRQVFLDLPDELKWSRSDGDISYQIYLGTNEAQTESATPLSDLFLGGSIQNAQSLEGLISHGGTYYWRIDTIRDGETVKGEVSSFTINHRIHQVGVPGGAAATEAKFQDPLVLLDSSNLVSIDRSDSGFSTDAQKVHRYPGFGSTGSRSSAFAGEFLVIGNSGSGVGISGDRDRGEIAMFTPLEHGWSAEWARTPESFLEPKSFGISVAANHSSIWTNQQASGTTGPNAGVLHVYDLEGNRTQSLQPSDSFNGDRFGSKTIIRGNTAVVEANGWGASFQRRYADLYVFERNPANNQWTEVQKLSSERLDRDHPGEFSFDGSRIAVQIDSRNPTLIEVFEKNLSGRWVAVDRIIPDESRDDIRVTFKDNVSISGDWLCVDAWLSLESNTNSVDVVIPFHRRNGIWEQQSPIRIPDSFGGFLETSLSGDQAVDGGMVMIWTNDVSPGMDRNFLVILDEQANRRPRLTNSLPKKIQLPANAPVSIEIDTIDPNGDDVALEIISKPSWLRDRSPGPNQHVLEGMVPAITGKHSPIEFRLNDGKGGQRWYFSLVEVVSDDAAPKISGLPESLEIKQGHDLRIEPEIAGAKPIEFQWELNGTPLPGQTESRLHIEGWPSEGLYRLTARNAVGMEHSTEVMVSVTESDRLGQDWTAVGGSFNASSYMPARLGRHTFVPKWSSSPELILPSTENHFAVSAQGIVTESLQDATTASVHFLNLSDGSLRESTVTAPPDLSPPSIHDGRAWFHTPDAPRNDPTPPSTVYRAFDLLDIGTSIEMESDQFLGSYLLGPILQPGSILLNRKGRPGAVWHDHPVPSQLAVAPIDNCSLHEHVLYSSHENLFAAHRASDNRMLWSIALPDSSARPVVRGDHAILSSRNSISCIDIRNRQLTWTFEHSMGSVRNVAIDESHAYIAGRSTVSSVFLSDGSPSTSYTSPVPNESLISVIVLEDHLLAYSDSWTHVFDKQSGQFLQSLELGGEVAYSNGLLVGIGGTRQDRRILAYYPNAAPIFSEQFPDSIIDPGSAADLHLALGATTLNPDPNDPLFWRIISNSRPEIFRSLEISAENGDLTVIYNPWESGSSEVTISAEDTAGNVTETTITFTVPELPLPDLRLTSNLQLKRQTGLFEQSITVTNNGAREIAGFDLTVTGLPEGVCLNNSSNCEEGTWAVEHRQPLAAGASVTLILEYYAPVRGTVLDPQIEVSLVTIPESDPAAVDEGLAVDRCVRLDDGLLIEFVSEPGELYEVQYSNNGTDWKVSPVRIRAAGNRVQWIDRGPPRTDSPPADKPSRFYRVREITSDAE